MISRRTTGWLAFSVLPVPRVVGVARPVRLEDVVRRVVQAAEAERRPVVVAFRRVVEDDVEDDLDAGAVQRLDQVAELVDGAERVAPRAVAGVGREEGDRRVAPVVRPGPAAQSCASNWNTGSSSTAVIPGPGGTGSSRSARRRSRASPARRPSSGWRGEARRRASRR